MWALSPGEHLMCSSADPSRLTCEANSVSRHPSRLTCEANSRLLYSTVGVLIAHDGGHVVRVVVATVVPAALRIFMFYIIIYMCIADMPRTRLIRYSTVLSTDVQVHFLIFYCLQVQLRRGFKTVHRYNSAVVSMARKMHPR